MAIWFPLIFAAFISAVSAQSGMQSVKLAESRLLVEKSPYAVVLRDLGDKTKRDDLFYGFFTDKLGADHMYQFNSLKAFTAGRADVVWFFRENQQCVPNSAAVVNGILYCRIFTNKYDEYSNPSVSRRNIAPVKIAAFNLGGVSTGKSGELCSESKSSVPYPNTMEATMIVSTDIFDRLPPSATSTVNFLDKYDLSVPSSSILQRPNMNVAFHADASGMWLLVPYQYTENGNPFLRRLRVDPATLATSQVVFPRKGNFSDTTQTIMMQFGIGVTVDGYYYGLSRTGDGNTYFRQRHSPNYFSFEMGPYTTAKDGAYLLLASANANQYVSALQFHPVYNEILFTVKDLSAPLGEQFKHIAVPVVLIK